MSADTINHWPSGARDTTEFPKVNVSIDVIMREHLRAFTQMEGSGWTDYDAMNAASGSSMTGSRLRTYRKLYEKCGLIFRDDDKIRLSRLGQRMAALESDLLEKKEEVLDKARATAIDILSRYQLQNPSDNDPLPADCDVLPAICIWKAMRALDNKLHPEEINRVLIWIMHMADLDKAIARIRAARQKFNGSYIDTGESELQKALGTPLHTNQAQARIAPWFSFIGWGGLIIEQNVDELGFRNLVTGSIPIIDKILEKPPVYYPAKDESDWLAYYIGKDLNEEKEADLMIETELMKKHYSVDELGGILKKMYDSGDNKTTSIHMFGIKYAQIIKQNNYAATAIVAASGLSPNYHAEISKGVRIYESIQKNEFGIRFIDEEASPTAQEIPTVSATVKKTLPVVPPRARKIHALNSILYGAPGTGKTYATAQYALAIVENKPFSVIASEGRQAVMTRYNNMVDEGRVVFTTFHQNYGYEDFIQGIRPDTSSSAMAFKTVDGVFKQIADNAIQHPDLDYVIIIDEINRANISKVFGELITLIEDDKRWGEVNAIDATLPSGDLFAVPNNLYILGTMNSADKSISLIDTALRRRFDFIEHEPRLDLVADADLRIVLDRLNRGIATQLASTDLLIGHSYFMNKGISDLCDIMNRNIIPLLYEYFFDDQKKVEAQVKTATDGYPVEVKSASVGRIKLVQKGV